MALELLDLSVCGASECGLSVLNMGQVEYTAEGGLGASGAAQVSVNPYVLSTSGGIETGGGALVSVHITPVSDTCSIEVFGDAPYSVSYTPASSGGKQCTGEAIAAASYTVEDSGGTIEAESSALVEPCYLTIGSGDVETSGAAPVTIEIPYTATGGITADGTAIVKCDFIIVDAFSGEAIFTGEALTRLIIDVSGLPVFIRRYDGDVRLKISEDGGIITVWGGQPDMDQGFETAVNISLFTETGWWGNSLANPGEEIGSDFINQLSQPLTNQARLNIIEAAKNALAWITSSGIAFSVTVNATIPEVGQLALYIEIKESEEVKHIFRYNINWQAQKIKMTEAAA